MKTRVSRARALHPHDQNSPDPLNTTKQLFFDLRCILRRSHSKGMDIETNTRPFVHFLHRFFDLRHILRIYKGYGTETSTYIALQQFPKFSDVVNP